MLKPSSSALDVNVFRKIGKRPIKEIRSSELLHAIQTLEQDGKRDLAHRMLQHCGQIFRYAISKGLTDTDIANNLKELYCAWEFISNNLCLGVFKRQLTRYP